MGIGVEGDRKLNLIINDSPVGFVGNQIDRLIDEHLTTLVDDVNVSDSNIVIEGREELIKQLENLIITEKIKQRISVLESTKIMKS
jgi:acyl-CoA synthetase (NDP forming)